MKIIQPHTVYSMRKLLDQQNFDGMVEIEFLSNLNLKFSFPAVNAFYQSGTHYSVVHGGGRIRNDNEKHTPAKSIETNWTCKILDDVIPFFHIFNGPKWNGLGTTKIDLFSTNGSHLATRECDFDLKAPYSSKIIFLDELFDLAKYEDHEVFLAVTMPDAEFFPRMVVGNYHKKLNFLETGHSFYWSTIEDFLEPQKEVSLLSFIPVLKAPALDLDIISYPTNAPCVVNGKIRIADTAGKLQPTEHQVTWCTGGKNIPAWKFGIKDDINFLCIDFDAPPVPARINASYRYKVKNAPENNFSTDIATGAHAYVYPQKFSHWGSAIISTRYETVLMIRNVCQRTGQQKDASGLLQIFLPDNQLIKHEITTSAESGSFIYLSTLIDRPESETIFSWFLNMDCPDIETYWISFANDGSICGDHSF